MKVRINADKAIPAQTLVHKMAPAHDTVRVFTTGRRLLNIFTTFMGCCKKVDSKCSGNGLLMKTGFVNDEKEKGRDFSDDNVLIEGKVGFRDRYLS